MPQKENGSPSKFIYRSKISELRHDSLSFLETSPKMSLKQILNPYLGNMENVLSDFSWLLLSFLHFIGDVFKPLK